MTVSLLEIAKVGGHLHQNTGDEIHYPETGTSLISKIEEEHFWFVVRREFLLKTLVLFSERKKTALVGLDIGCGSGLNSVWLTEKGFPTLGVDAYEGFSAYKKEKRGLGFVRGDIFSIEPKAEFDFVMLLDVLEHIEDDSSFVAQAAKFLKPGGILIVTVPAFQWLWSPFDTFSGHLRRYNKKSLNSVLNREECHLEVTKICYFYGLTLPLYLISRLKNKKKTIENEQNKELFPNPIVNFVLGILLRFEALFLRMGGLPLGSSIFSVTEKMIN